jgi:hypothetical protein
MVRPSTVPHGLKTVSGVTTPVGRGANVVDVDVDVPSGSDVPVASVDAVVCGTDGAVVAVEFVSAAMTFSPPATQDDARMATARERSAAVRIVASVETGSE